MKLRSIVLSSQTILFLQYSLLIQCVIIVVFLQNASIEYSLESLYVFVCVHPSVCYVCFLHDNSKSYRSRNTKIKYIVVYEKSPERFDIGQCQIKVQVRALMLCKHVLRGVIKTQSINIALVILYKICE